MPIAPTEAEPAGALRAIHASAPLIHNMTNFVVAKVTANILPALGTPSAIVKNGEGLADPLGAAAAPVLEVR